MAKLTSVYVCQYCGARSSKWSGKCFECSSWNSLIEEVEERSQGKDKAKIRAELGVSAKVQSLEEILESKTEASLDKRMTSGFSELDRVLGGGFLKGSICLFGGEPGIGKSTLLLQSALSLSERQKCLYISGEESVSQIGGRAKRLGFGEKLSLNLLSTSDLDEALAAVDKVKPEIVIVDSVQTLQDFALESASGSVSQIRAVCEKFLRLSKEKDICTLLVGHVNKEGAIAGPRLLEHMVDAVFYFELASSGSYRMIRASKNRFGATHELGVFEMTREGLRQVVNPSERFLEERARGMAGSAVIAHLEGSRPFLTEVQALCQRCYHGYPRRTMQGVDANRISVLIAVLEKHLDSSFAEYDVYAKVASGIKVDEPAADFALLAALYSARENIVLPEDVIFIGEVGLGGELRSVSAIEARLAEAKTVGIKRAYVPHWNAKELGSIKGIEVLPVKSVKILNEVYK